MGRVIKKIAREYRLYRDKRQYDKLRGVPCRKSEKLNWELPKLETVWKHHDSNCFEEMDLPAAEGKVDISVIVPLYNSVSFIDGLMDSLLNQNTKYNYEIILINDGSTDDTQDVAQTYADDNANVFLFSTENRGIACARNYGMKCANGRYFAFVDHDDRVKNSYIERLYSAALETGAAVVKCGYIEGGNQKGNKSYECVNGMEDIMFKLPSYIWGGIFSRSLMTNIRFPEGYWYEDMVVRTLLYRKTDSFVNVEDVLYSKVTHRSNASHIIWNNGNPKCIEQLYLLKELIEASDKLGLPRDIMLFRCILRECSKIMVTRISGLEELSRIAVFADTRELIEELYCDKYKECITGREQEFLESILVGDFDRWELLGRI